MQLGFFIENVIRPHGIKAQAVFQWRVVHARYLRRSVNDFAGNHGLCKQLPGMVVIVAIATTFAINHRHCSFEVLLARNHPEELP